jgi:hypothetical protein
MRETDYKTCTMLKNVIGLNKMNYKDLQTDDLCAAAHPIYLLNTQRQTTHNQTYEHIYKKNQR